MKFWNKLRYYFGTQNDWMEDYNLDDDYDAFERRVISRALSIENENCRNNFNFTPTDIERERCIRIFNATADFTELEAATAMSVLCQTHMDIVINSIMNEINNLKDKIKR